MLDFGRPRVGIYVLEFADGQEYVGQTVDLRARLATHLRRWNDVVAIRFAGAVAETLGDLERQVIAERRSAGTVLRNVTLVTQPVGPSQLDLWVDPQVQAAWLSSDPEAAVVIGDRAQFAERRRRSRARFLELQSSPAFVDVVSAVAAYVAEVIPWPHQTEGRHWTLTAMPGTHRTTDHRRLATLSINMVEMLYIGQVRTDEGWRSYTCLNTLPMLGLPRHLPHVPRRHGDYRSLGSDVLAWEVDGIMVGELLSEPGILAAARALAMSQLRKGRGAFSRFHNELFADQVFLEIEAQHEGLSRETD